MPACPPNCSSLAYSFYEILLVGYGKTVPFLCGCEGLKIAVSKGFIEHDFRQHNLAIFLLVLYDSDESAESPPSLEWTLLCPF